MREMRKIARSFKYMSFTKKSLRHHFIAKNIHNFIFIIFLAAFYAFVLLYIKPVDGINDDWGMYSILSGAYTGSPDTHVLFFLYPLSWLLCELYQMNSSIPWYGIFQHSVHVLCIFLVYRRSMQLWRKHASSHAVIFPALTILGLLFFIIDFNVICEAQYTTTAGFVAATALFYFITTRSSESILVFLRGNIPTLLLAWLAFCMRRNVLYMMLPIAGMLWLAKWAISRQKSYSHYILKLFSFAAILLAGAGILAGIHAHAYAQDEWADFIKINHYRERIGDFYTWPEYEECADRLSAIGIDEETYHYRRAGAPYIGHQMSLEDWEAMHDIAKDCYHARTSVLSQIKNILKGSITVFLYQDGMQPANLCAAILLLLVLFCILYQRNLVALAVYLFYLFGRSVAWGYVLFEGRFPKRIVQPLITADFMVLLGILLAFNLLNLKRQKIYAFLLPCIIILSAVSVYCTKTNIDASYHANQPVWDDLKEYCYSHPDNFYIWTYDSGTLDNYCESPFDTTLDTYQNFFYTNWGVVCNPNSKKKLAKHGIENFGEDLAASQNVYFIFRKGLYHKEHPVIMYFRHTYQVGCELADTFRAGGYDYEVYQLR